MRHIHARLRLVPAQVPVLDCGLRESPGQRGTDLLGQPSAAVEGGVVSHLPLWGSVDF